MKVNVVSHFSAYEKDKYLWTGIVLKMLWKSKKVLIAGGDMRQVFLAQLLCSLGAEVFAWGFDDPALFSPEIKLLVPGELAPPVEICVLPLPILAGGRLNAPLLEKPVSPQEIEAVLPKNALIFGGIVPEGIFPNHRIFDYYKSERIPVRSAVSTAEGAIAIAVNEAPHDILGSNALVLGYGRVGRALSFRLAALGAFVTVVTRNDEECFWAKSYGIKTESFDNLKEIVKNSELVFNTVPAPVMTREILSGMKNSALIIDLASRPGGVDFAAAGEFGLKTLHALSLPGRVSPASCAEAILEELENIITSK